MDDLTPFLIFSVVIISLLFITEIVFKYLKIKTEYTRKFVHFSSGLLTLYIPFFIENHWLILLLTIGFIAVLVLSKKYKLLQSIDSVNRKTYGSYLFPVGVYLCYLISVYFKDKYIFVIAILVLSISDTLASIVGTFYQSKTLKRKWIKDKKTIAGSLAFFISAVLIIAIALHYFYSYKTYINIGLAFTISGISTYIEIGSRKGFDNVSVPITVSFLLGVSFYFLNPL